jgi:hypothetical protein
MHFLSAIFCEEPMFVMDQNPVTMTVATVGIAGGAASLAPVAASALHGIAAGELPWLDSASMRPDWRLSMQPVP